MANETATVAEWAAFEVAAFANQKPISDEDAKRCEDWAAAFVARVQDAGIIFA